MAVSSGIRTLLKQLHASYLEGLKRPAPENTGNEQALAKLHQEMEEFFRARLHEAEWAVVAQAAEARERGLRAARSQQVELARKWFSNARAIAESSLMSDVTRLFHSSRLAAAEAYLDYRCNDPDGARQRLAEALAADESLEKKYPHKLFHFHRLHLTENLIRVEMLAGNVETALEMAKGIVCYLTGASGDSPLPGSWNPSLLPPESIPYLLTGVIVEICQILGGRTPESSRPQLAIIEDRLPALDSTLWQPQALDWFITKSKFVKEDIPSFLERAALYLSSGSATSVLWRYVALDVVIACDGLPLEEEAWELQRLILRDAPEWKRMSIQLRSLVQDLAAGFACRSMKVGTALP